LKILPSALVLVGIVATVGSYKVAAAPSRDWVRVARDPNYDVAIDRSHIRALLVPTYPRAFDAYEVWYRTDHAKLRAHKDKTFDREIVRAVVQCDSMWFKVRSVDMSIGDGRTVARQRTTDEELVSQPWRPVERGATEETAALAACHFGHRLGNRVVAKAK
jgi:hypothetical protein